MRLAARGPRPRYHAGRGRVAAGEGERVIRAVIFDMDGLMVDSEPVWGASWAPALALHGLEEAPGLAQACRGSSRAAVTARVAEFYGPDVDATAIVEDFFAIAQATLMDEGAPKKPGLDELLAWLGAHEVPCAVASSSPYELICSELARAGVLDKVAYAISGNGGALPSKPAPDIFWAAAEGIGADPASTLVLEDSVNGARAGVAGGFVTVMVPDLQEPTDDLRAGCARICADLLEVRDLLAAGAL